MGCVKYLPVPRTNADAADGAINRMRIIVFLLLIAPCFTDDDYSFDTLPGIDRYTRFERMPDPSDTERIILAAGDVKCPVCHVILTDVLKGIGKQFNAEAIVEALEADDVDESKVDPNWSDKERQVYLKKRGCNKLYKDNYLSKGWAVVGCYRVPEGVDMETVAPYDKAKWTCANHTGYKPNRTELNTYNLANEAIHHACEYTIGTHRDTIAKYVVAERRKNPESSTNPNSTLESIAYRACELKAHCLKRKPSESVEVRQKLAREEWQGHGEEVLAKVIKEEKEQKKAEKAAARKRRKRKQKEDADAGTVEL